MLCLLSDFLQLLLYIGVCLHEDREVGGGGGTKVELNLVGSSRVYPYAPLSHFCLSLFFCNNLDTYSLNVDYYGLCCISEC